MRGEADRRAGEAGVRPPLILLGLIKRLWRVPRGDWSAWRSRLNLAWMYDRLRAGYVYVKLLHRSGGTWSGLNLSTHACPISI